MSSRKHAIYGFGKHIYPSHNLQMNPFKLITFDILSETKKSLAHFPPQVVHDKQFCLL